MVWLDIGVSEGALGAPCCDTRPLGRDGLELTVRGMLAPDWAARVTARLARFDLSIVRGSTVADEHGYWTSRFEIEVSRTRDYGKFGDRTLLDVDAPPPSTGGLEHHRLTPSADHGSTLRLDVVEAPDCVGFLAALFWKIRDQSLMPVRFEMETRAGLVFDSVWLKAEGKRMPSAEACDALRSHLDELLAA